MRVVQRPFRFFKEGPLDMASVSLDNGVTWDLSSLWSNHDLQNPRLFFPVYSPPVEFASALYSHPYAKHARYRAGRSGRIDVYTRREGWRLGISYDNEALTAPGTSFYPVDWGDTPP